MKIRLLERVTGTLFAQVFALVLVAIIGAQAINIWTVFHIHPPPPAFYTETEVLHALRGQPGAVRKGAPLLVHTEPGPVQVDPDSRIGYGRFRTALGADLGIKPEDIMVITDGVPVDRRGYLLVRDRLNERGAAREESFLFAPFKLVMKLPDGRWATVQPEQKGGIAPWQQRLVLWFAVSAVAVLPLAYFFARGLSKPLTSFAEAAERFGRDPRSPPLNLRGSSEITKAVTAFNEMQDRLRRYVEDRTSMVAAIAHDLRTPLTRLRFRIEAAPEEAQAKMNSDIDQMEAMIAATLVFVRDAAGDPQRSRLELSSLLESVVDDLAETGADVTVGHTEKVVIDADGLALRRLLTNLLENALKYGVRARTRLSVSNGLAEIDVDDDGPGVPNTELNRVFDPFYRREPSRSRQTGGIGLGLSVARSIARAHGGDVTLLNRAQGGLTARVVLPV